MDECRRFGNEGHAELARLPTAIALFQSSTDVHLMAVAEKQPYCRLVAFRQPILTAALARGPPFFCAARGLLCRASRSNESFRNVVASRAHKNTSWGK